MPFELVFELLADGVSQGVGRFKATELLKELGGKLGQLELFHFEHLELHRHVLAAERFDGRFGGDLHLGGDRVARLGLLQKGIEAGQLGVGEGELRPHHDLELVGLGEELVAVEKPQVGDDQVARRRGTVMRHEPAALAKDVAEGLLDVGGGDLARGPLDREPLPLGHLEFRTHLDRKFEGHRPFVGQDDGADIEIGLADRRELLLFGDLGHRLGEQLGTDLVAELGLEAAAHERPRRPARTKARQQCAGHQFGDGLLEVAVDVFARDRHLHPPLAGRGLLDRDVELERLADGLVGVGGGESGGGVRHGGFPNGARGSGRDVARRGERGVVTGRTQKRK